jgi:hypothetical protein
MIAAIGTDGTRPVVWGLGATVEEATAEARRWAGDIGEDLDMIGTVEVDAERAARIEAGDIDANDLVRRTRDGRVVVKE